MKSRRSTSKSTSLLKPIETSRQFAWRLTKGFSIAGVLTLISVCFLPFTGGSESAPWGLFVISLVGFTGLVLLSTALDDRAEQLGRYFSYLGLTIRNVLKLLLMLFLFLIVAALLVKSPKNSNIYPADYPASIF